MSNPKLPVYNPERVDRRRKAYDEANDRAACIRFLCATRDRLQSRLAELREEIEHCDIRLREIEAEQSREGR